jgi:hypothetical protein
MDVSEARRSSSASSAAEFQFWPLDADPTASPSCADELFAGGVLLPLPVLPPKAASHSRTSSGHVSPAKEPEPEPERKDTSLLAAAAVSPVAPSAAITSPVPPAAAGGGSKRWTDIFSKKPAEEKEKRKDAGGWKPAPLAAGSRGGSELNINIWPFSRSRSAGGSGSGSSTKQRLPTRKVSSAPCSRSNSRGEAAGPPLPPRRWAASPGRAGGGVPVGRSSPVWQIRRPAPKHASVASDPLTDRRAPALQQHKDKPAAGGGRKQGGGVRGLNLSVNSCIGYRHQASCRPADAARGDGGGLFGIKGFFSKKVH